MKIGNALALTGIGVKDFHAAAAAIAVKMSTQTADVAVARAEVPATEATTAVAFAAFSVDALTDKKTPYTEALCVRSFNYSAYNYPTRYIAFLVKINV